LTHFEEKMLSCRFDSMMIFLNDLPKNDFFRDPEIVHKYIQYMNKSSGFGNRISNELLHTLEREYHKIRSINTSELIDQKIQLLSPRGKKKDSHKIHDL
jgi:hypothetical protein